MTFPDWAGATAGKTMDEATLMAEDFLGLACWDAEVDKEPLPTPTNPKKLEVGENSFVVMVSADTAAYRRKMSNKTVKKTLSIPEWLNTMALEENINFSGVLQDALKEKLGIA
ncbi:MAG: type II toxin-antitoxin system HicB family antitoxin [Schwartzia sp.]|nr:type II toxin-antitoxin system HicB family antitoxin [Schwartzia sp. (in: firmicutes)]